MSNDARKNDASYTILLVGCGKMGGAMAEGWLKAGIAQKLIIMDPMVLPQDIGKYENVVHIKTTEELSNHNAPDCVVMAVKPQIMNDVCASLKPYIQNDSVIISIAAGTPIVLFEKHFGAQQPIIRSMPNTPAAIGKGVTAAFANNDVTQDQREIADTILSISGTLEWVENEDMFHAITALSGSGPAYIFLLIETMTQAGIDIGLSEELAKKLARQTIIGSAALAEHDAATEAAQLRKNVTSPGGTTEAALNILMDGRLDSLFKEALNNAKTRSIELAGD